MRQVGTVIGFLAFTLGTCIEELTLLKAKWMNSHTGGDPEGLFYGETWWEVMLWFCLGNVFLALCATVPTALVRPRCTVLAPLSL